MNSLKPYEQRYAWPKTRRAFCLTTFTILLALLLTSADSRILAASALLSLLGVWFSGRPASTRRQAVPPGSPAQEEPLPPRKSPLPETVRELPTIPALQERLRGLNAIVTGFAHEINNPLTGIMGYLDLLDIQSGLPAQAKQKLTMIRTQAQRIHAIIQQIHHLDPSLQDVRQEIDLRNLLEKMVKVLRRQSESAAVAFSINLTESPAIIQGHHYYLYQVFEGIVQNAIEAAQGAQKAHGHSPRVDLSLQVLKQEAHVTIRDNGPGFQDAVRAFDPFYTTKSRASKRGMGLAIAHNIVLEHRGSITIENTPRGAEVHITLPLSQADPISPATRADGSPTVEE